MKKVPDVGVPRTRGRPPKQAAIETSTPVTGEGAQLSVTGPVELDVPINQASADTASSERQHLNSGLKSRKGGKSASLGSAKMTGRKKHQDSSDRTSSDDKRYTSSSRRSSKDQLKTLLYKAVKQKAQKVSQQGKSSTSRILSREKPKKGLPISQKKKSKLRKICSSKIKKIKSTKTEAIELSDSLTTEMRRLVTTDGFWSTKASSRSNSPQSQSVDSHFQRQTAATKKDSRTSTPDITPSGSRRHSFSKTRPDKDDTTPQRSNISVAELRRLRTTEGFSFAENAVTSKTNSRDVSPCSSSSLDRGTRLNSRSIARSNENKNGMKVDDADQVAVADDVISARNKITKKESCNSKDKLSEDQREIVSTVNPPTADVKFIHCDGPVSRFRKKHFLDKVASITKQKRLSRSSQSKKMMTLMQETSKRQRIKSPAVTTQSAAGKSSAHPKFSTSTNTPEVNKGKRFSRHTVDKGITEKTTERRKKGKQKQQNIVDAGTATPNALLEEMSHIPAASDISLGNSISSTKSNVPEFLITDLIESAELKRLNTTAGFWSAASGAEKIYNIHQPRKLRDADGNSINEANYSVKLKPVRQRNLHLAKFSKTAVATSTLLQHRKKKVRSLQSKLTKTEKSAPSNDLAEQQQPPVVNISPAPTDGGFGRKSRPKACPFGVRRHRRKRVITLEDRSTQEIQTVGESFDVVHSEANPKELTEPAISLIDANGSKCEKDKCVLQKNADLNSSEIDTKTSTVYMDYLIAKHDGDTTENGQVVKTSKELLDVEMYSLTSAEKADVSMDTSVNDTPSAQKTLMKMGKKGQRKLSSGEVCVKPSNIQTRGRGKGDSTMDNSLEVLPSWEPRNEEALLTSSSATSKVVSEKQKTKKAKKASLAELDLSQHMSGSELDRKPSHPVELTHVNLKPSNKDALLASSSATSKVVSDRQKKKKAKKEYLAKLDLPEHMSGCEIDKKSSHPAEIAEINVEPNNKDTLLTSSATSKVVSERWKTKKAKKASLAELDLTQHMSGSELDRKPSHPAEITPVNLVSSNKDALLASLPATPKVVSVRRKTKKESLAESDLSEIDKTLFHPAEITQLNLEPTSKDALLASSPATSKVVSESQKIEEVKEESLAELDLCERVSGCEIDKKSSHTAEIAEIKNLQIKDDEKDNSPDQKISTSEVGSIGKQNSVHTKCNLFESLGFSLSMPSEDSPVSFVNSSTCVVRDPFCLNENVAESHFMIPNLPATENVCDMKLNDVLCLLQTESTATNVSGPTESVSPQQLKGAELKVTDAGTGFVSGTLEEVGAGCLDVYHDSVVYTPEGAQDLQSAPSSDNIISFEPVIQGCLQTDVSNTTSVSESQNYATSVDVLVPEAKTVAVKGGHLTCELSGVIESSSLEDNTSAENTTASAVILECVTSEKQNREDESTAIIKNIIIDTLEASNIEDHVENMQPAESCVEMNSFIPHESKTVISTSADISLFEKLQNDLTEQSLFAETEGDNSNNVSMESVAVDNREQCQVLKSGSINATDDTAEGIVVSVKSVVGDDKVDSVTLDSAAEFEKSGSSHSSCEHTNFKPQKRKSKETVEFPRFKIHKHMVKTAVTPTSLDTKCLSFSADRLAIYDFNSSEEVAESTLNEENKQEANNAFQAPVKKARKRKRNAWQRGVLRKAAHLSRKPNKPVKSVSPDQSDMSSSVLVSDGDQFYCVDDVEEIVLDDDKVCVPNGDEKIVSQDDTLSVANDVKKVVSNDDKICVADDVEKIVDDKVCAPDDTDKIFSDDNKTCVADNVEKIVSDDDGVCVADDAEMVSSLASTLFPDIVEGNQLPDCLHENNILLPALNSSCEAENQPSPRVQMCREAASDAVIPDISTKISDLNDGNIKNSDGCNIQISVDDIKISDDKNIKISDESNIKISGDSKINSSNDSNINISDDSKITISDGNSITTSDDSSIKISDDCEVHISNYNKIQVSCDSKIQFSVDNNIQFSDDSKIQVSDDNNIQFSDDSKIQVSDDNNINFSDDSKIQVPANRKIQISDDNWKHAISIPLATCDDKTTPPISEHLLSKNGQLLTEEYPPAVTKSLKNMLKKLQTNANLAHADFGAQSYKGKFLRRVQQKEQQQKRLRIKRQLLHADKIEKDSEGMVPSSVDPQIGVSELPVKKKRGRPRKQTGEALPKLTPEGMLPILRSVIPWNNPPPDLSPQDLTLPPFSDVCDVKSMQDADIVSESVDDTDLHLYLSGVSDEEQSPRKDASLVSFHADISVYQEKKDSGGSVYEEIKDSGIISVYPDEKGSGIFVSPEKKDSSIMQKMVTDKPFGSEEPFITQNSMVVSGKEPKKRGRPKKGSRGCPPGIPMTDEERLKRKHDEKLKRRKVFKEECEDQNLLHFLRTSQGSVDTSDVFATPNFSGSASSPSGNFSLRKKSTRSPLEMIAIKRKQEEAIYDMEQERRQARLIHLREKRCARESEEGFSDDDIGEDSSENLMTCSVVLNDFVKKLQLDELDLSSGEEVSHEALENVRPGLESPDYNPFEDRNEDWRADFEERESEEWNNNRPSIPRLKLKRVIKKGIQSQAKIPKQTAESPKEPPIKLVIKTEPTVEPNEQAGLRLSSGIDSSKVERSGFENSYMDFLKKKTQFVPGKGDVAKRSYNVPRSAQLQVGTQIGITDLNAVEILSLPTSGVRGALAVVTNSLITGVQPASAGRLISGSASVGDRASALALTKVGPNAYPLTTLSSLEHAGTSKPALSVDDDEDILILDLEDGAVEQNSHGLPRFPGSASSAVHQTHGIVNPTTNNESISENYASRIDNASLIHLQRSFSNDEMGLMFESYNSQKDSDKLSQLGVAENAADIFVSAGNFDELSGNKDTGVPSDIPQPLACEFIDVSIKATVSVPQPQKSQYEVQTPDTVDISSDTLIGSAGPSNQDSKEIGESVSVAVSDDITNTNAFLNTGHTDGVNSAYCKKQSDGDSISVVNKATDSVIMNTVVNDVPKDGDVFDSEISAVAASNKAVAYVPGDVSSDKNNVTSACTSPLKTGSFKKPGMALDNKSPKHSTYHGSVPEDWRVKVILHSDKFLSGKYSCKRCSFTAPSKLAIESHIYSHIPGVQFRCAYCESEFSSMAATSSHLKNTHSLSEAKLHISRPIDEKNFYDKEAAVFSEENGQQSPVHPTSASTNAGGQSPPVIISVVVSSRGGRSSAHRFVCTHCGFSTNVKEDAEHHVLDLHSTQALFACLLCSENVCYTESEIKDHCAVVHPARKHPYKKLPDFYDAELLSLKEKAASQDDRENIFERMSSLFQDETQPSISNIDHKQKAKEYLYLQEGWKEKTKVEADSTTAGDYTDEADDTEEPLARLAAVEIESPAESINRSTAGENEVFADHRSSSQVSDDSERVEAVCETAALINDDFITSSAGASTHINIDSQVESDAGSERHDHQTLQAKSFSSQLEELPSHAARETTEDEDIQHVSLVHEIEDNDDDDDGGGMGLKIVQVVSLSEQSQDLDEQMTAEQEHVGRDSSTGSCDIPQVGTVVSENTFSGSTVPEFSSEHSSTPVDIAPAETPLPSSTEKETPTAGTTVAAELSATKSPAADTSSVPSPIASPSFAGGLPLSYKCNACRVHTPYLLMMVKHLKAKHPNMRCFSCPYCKTAQSFVSQKQLRHHVKQSHPAKFGRNEIALSEDAKKFVEAMVLPIGPECIRVGNRIVLEEDIHTCTYCQVKMVSLTSVYEHLNTKHSDLFEFVCPVCQNFRSKLLPEIFDHCLHTHKSSLDTDKVHVSVPKNLFTALTCISKSGKYIEKTLALGSPEKIPAGPSSSTLQQPEKAHVTASPRRVPQLSTQSRLYPEQHPLSETVSATTPLIPVVETLPTTQAIHPIFAVPLTSTSIGAAASATRPVIPFSSSLFDTSSLTSPQLAVASHSIPFMQNAAAASFLSPLPQQAHSNHQHMQSGKQLHPKSSERTHGSVKNLPVLNVPTIRPRTSPVAAKAVAGSPVEAMQLNAPNCNLSVMSTAGPGQQSFRSSSSSSIIDNLPDNEPNPDAFKIFNLCPTGPRTSPAPAASLPPGVPSVFPPVSAPMAAGYIQGTIAGFPPGMVIPPNLLFSYSQHPSVMQGLLAQKQNPQTSSMARHPHLSHSSSAHMAAQSTTARRNSMTSEAAAATAYLKKQQQRELYLKKQQHQQQLESHRHQLFRLSQQQTVQRAYPAHQQPPSLSGQVYQPQPLPAQSLSYDQHQALAGPSDQVHASIFTSSVAASASSAQLMAHSSPSPGRPAKGLHKRSNTLYQCPYCPVMVTLKALEVASHIQQHHPGKQVTFRKIV